MEEQGGSILYLVTEDWYFWSHRLATARAARDAGFKVAIATRVSGLGESIRNEGFSLHELGWKRGSLSLVDAARALVEITSIYRRERPDIVHHVALKAVVFGGIAAAVSRIPHVINALTGLGHLFTSDSRKAWILRIFLHPVIRLILRMPRSITLLQNRDDLIKLEQLGLVRENAVIIRGSGVDIDYYRPLPNPGGSDIVTAAYVGRMIEIKGVRTLMEAHRRLRQKGGRLRLLLVGARDSENPGAISSEEISGWAQDQDVEWLGHCADIRFVWARADIGVLASLGGEGLPKSLLEAAACGRPLIATDVPGCREIALDGRNAILVPPGDADALCNAMECLAGSESLREAFGRESRRIVETDLSQDNVTRETQELYRKLMGSGVAQKRSPA